jgi:hypothetical protein
VRGCQLRHQDLCLSSGRRGSNPRSPAWQAGAIPVSPRPHKALHLPRVQGSEPARRLELRLPPYRGGVLPLSLNRHSWPGRTRTCVASPGSRPGGPCQQSNRPSKRPGGGSCAADPDPPEAAFGLRAAVRCRSGPPALREPGRKPCAAAWCARPELNRDAPRGAQASRACASACSATSARSRHPGSNRVTRRTKAEPQAVRGGMKVPARHRFRCTSTGAPYTEPAAGHPGLEPGSSGVRARQVYQFP